MIFKYFKIGLFLLASVSFAQEVLPDTTSINLKLIDSVKQSKDISVNKIQNDSINLNSKAALSLIKRDTILQDSTKLSLIKLKEKIKQHPDHTYAKCRSVYDKAPADLPCVPALTGSV